LQIPRPYSQGIQKFGAEAKAFFSTRFPVEAHGKAREGRVFPAAEDKQAPPKWVTCPRAATEDENRGYEDRTVSSEPEWWDQRVD
jgi:hypothetical protein